MGFLEYSWVFERTSWNLPRTLEFFWNIKYFLKFLNTSGDFLITFWELVPGTFWISWNFLIPGIFLGLFWMLPGTFWILPETSEYFLEQYFLEFLGTILPILPGTYLYRWIWILFVFFRVIQGIFLSIYNLCFIYFWHDTDIILVFVF